MLLLRPLGVPTGKAIGVGLLWYGMTLLVSLIGAPAFAVGHRRGADSDEEDGADDDEGDADSDDEGRADGDDAADTEVHAPAPTQ